MIESENAKRNRNDRIFYDSPGESYDFCYNQTPEEIEASLAFRKKHNDKFVSALDRAGCLAVIEEQQKIIIKLHKQLESALTMCEQPMLECDIPE